MPLYWQKRPVYDAFEYAGDIQALRDWAATKDTSMTEATISRIEPVGTDGFQFYWSWNWDPNSEWTGQSGVIGDSIVDENNGQLNVRTPEYMAEVFEPVTDEEA